MKNKNFKGIVLFALLSTIFFSCEKNIQSSEEVRTAAESINADLKAQPIDELSAEFFSENPALTDNSELLKEYMNEFLEINASSENFAGKEPCKIVPIYAYGVEGVAYYEIWFTADGTTPEGWVLISATDKDYPIVNFSHDGQPYSQQAYSKSAKKGSVDKVYRFGVSYFTAEDASGELVAEQGEMPKYLLTETPVSFDGEGNSEEPELKKDDNVQLVEGVHYVSILDYEDLKNEFGKLYYTQSRQEQASKIKRSIQDKSRLKAGEYIYKYVPGASCYYTQIPANTSSNNKNCWSGCNNNAWASLYGWWDKNQSKSRLIPTATNGETCPTYRNTSARRAVVDPVQMYCASVCETYCNDGGGWTYWSKAYLGYKYAQSKGYGYSYKYRWCNNDGCHVELADILTECVGNNRKPAHIGANSHFYVALGYAQWSTNTDWTWAYCYPGWSEDNSDNVWISWHDFNSTVRMYVN